MFQLDALVILKAKVKQGAKMMAIIGVAPELARMRTGAEVKALVRLELTPPLVSS